MDETWFHLFADLIRMVQGDRFCSNDEVIAKTEAYFEDKGKIKKRWDDYITLGGADVHE